jgi:transcriptional regulator with XRE-family HTH domain
MSLFFRGSKISQMRDVFKMSQADLARRMGYTVQTISNWENGRRTPDTMNIFSLCRIFGVGMSFFFDQESGHKDLHKEIPEWLSPWRDVLFKLNDESQNVIIALLRIFSRNVIDLYEQEYIDFNDPGN